MKQERYDLIPVEPLRKLAEHFGRGAMKYDDHQWRQGYEWSKSYSALCRHLNAFWDGKEFDVCSNDPSSCSQEPFEAVLPDTCYNHTGSHHMTAVAWHAFVLMEFIEEHPDHDDRYSSPKAKTIAENQVAFRHETLQSFLDERKRHAIETFPSLADMDELNEKDD